MELYDYTIKSVWDLGIGPLSDLNRRIRFIHANSFRMFTTNPFWLYGIPNHFLRLLTVEKLIHFGSSAAEPNLSWLLMNINLPFTDNQQFLLALDA